MYCFFEFLVQFI